MLLAQLGMWLQLLTQGTQIPELILLGDVQPYSSSWGGAEVLRGA